MKYKVKWAYASSLGGPWQKGETVEVDEDIAEAINRDSPGVLEEVKPASQDRAQRKAQTRAEEK